MSDGPVLPVVPNTVYKVSINPIIQSKTRHAQIPTRDNINRPLHVFHESWLQTGPSNPYVTAETANAFDYIRSCATRRFVWCVAAPFSVVVRKDNEVTLQFGLSRNVT
jgi:hypothetical protein